MTSVHNFLIEYVANGSAIDPELRRAWQHCSALACHVTHRLRDIAIDELPPTCASPALGHSPRSTQRIVPSGDNGGRLGNYADPAIARAALPMHASCWVTILTANTTDTVHTSSFEYRAMLFQRLFASTSDFDLVCRVPRGRQPERAVGTQLVEELQLKPTQSYRLRALTLESLASLRLQERLLARVLACV